MIRPDALRFLLVLFLTVVSGCGDWTDAATRIAFDLEAAAGRLGKEEGARLSVRHSTPSKPGECAGPYHVQIDKVGALVIWCKDPGGRTVSSHSTTYHSRYVETPRSYQLDKPAHAPLTIDLERRGGRAVITDVR